MPQHVPGIVRTLGWSAIAAGGLICLVSLSLLPGSVEEQVRLGNAAESEIEAEAWFETADWLLIRFAGVAATLYIGFGCFCVVVGWALLRGSLWAMTGMEVACWLAVIYTLVFGAIRVLAAWAFLAPARDALSLESTLPLVMAGVVGRLILIIALVVAIIVVRGQRTKGSCQLSA